MAAQSVLKARAYLNEQRAHERLQQMCAMADVTQVLEPATSPLSL
jgi:hypothetical protein